MMIITARNMCPLNELSTYNKPYIDCTQLCAHAMPLHNVVGDVYIPQM